ncbi:peptide chain release factor N(5)-glutamine methyltransferase [Dethiosulfovibrio salsuginis]|uniref:Release factor glutamine methyltransferase n=1 Tax=Dethiosulfovibrio salsuginis TaxID=561720 RepID=A0A1X7KQL4_9BACT|nr:peptide chain release factor N(5)-glutamine methyltransferase [Dethiosulfovibrio salsuginis]SMG43827.1 release factor glutamine methyltransferase [Dethiosulfovibrio salsuginis]
MTDKKLSSLSRAWRGRLESAGVDNPGLDVDLICMEVLGVSRTWLHCHGDMELRPDDKKRVDEKVSRRERREPLHYILGKCPFWKSSFSVGEGCLIPRPETEFLLEAALEGFSSGLAVDWGTGSGCLAGSLLMEVPCASVVAVDRSPAAIDIAYRNLSDLGVLDRALLWHCSDPKDIPIKRGSVDLIVSNPPYIPTSSLSGLMDEVVGYEPLAALDGGDDGLDPYRALLPWAEVVLRPGGRLWVEFGGEEQVKPLLELTPQGLSVMEIRKDLALIPRLIGWCRV